MARNSIESVQLLLRQELTGEPRALLVAHLPELLLRHEKVGNMFRVLVFVRVCTRVLCVCACVFVSACAFVHMCICVCDHICVRMCVRACVCVFVRVYMHMCSLVSFFIVNACLIFVCTYIESMHAQAP